MLTFLFSSFNLYLLYLHLQALGRSGGFSLLGDIYSDFFVDVVFCFLFFCFVLFLFLFFFVSFSF